MEQNANNGRNFCLEMASVAAYNLNKNGGALNNKILMGNVYLILFLNYYCDTYCFDALDALRKTKHFKHEVKQNSKQALAFIDKHNNDICKHLDDFQDKFADMNLRLDEAFSSKIETLEKNIGKLQIENDGYEDKNKTRIIVATLLAEFATQYMSTIVNGNKQQNPIIAQVTWVSHEKLARLLERICDFIGVPPKVLEDIHVYDTWCQFKNRWYDPTFIANVLGIEDQSEENTEIKDSIMAKNS